MKSRTVIKGPEEPKGREEYLLRTEYLLKQKRGNEALLILKHALKQMPDDPFILSYYGCLVAIVDKKASQGAKICREVIEMVKRFQPLGEFIYPVFYLNLGRCYLAGGQKKRALEIFKEGLKMDAEDPDIHFELKRLGIRRRPPISFLPRANPLNKYIGLLLSKLKI
jgi:tetratricopeptide (TPR) repeat protein